MAVNSILRVIPPPIVANPDVSWLLLRAYGPVEAEVVLAVPDWQNAVANRLQLGTRIAVRHRAEVLERDFGRSKFSECRKELERQTFNGLAVVRMIQECADTTRDTGIDAVLLKFAALHEYGFVTVSTRPVADLDVLVAPDDVERLSDALVKSGATRLEKWVPSHHPAVLCSKFGKNIEIHTRLPHVRASGERGFASLESLRSADALVPCRGEGSRLFLPRRDVLLGHLIAHALVTHAYAPASYPVLRILGDVIDAGLAEDEQLAVGAAEWISDYVPQARVFALRELAQRCKRGDIADLFESNEPPALMLRHLIGSTIDEGYRRKLRRRRILQVFDEVGLGETLRHIVRRLRREWAGR